MKKPRILIFIPTYNEVENVENLFNQIKGLSLGADILFLDDNSPDGTGAIIDALVKKYPFVHVIHRSKKTGIGSAHTEGIRWAYARDYEQLITMDCDFSHSPEYLVNFIKESEKADVVVGSRYMMKDSLKQWSMYRKILTYIGHFLTDKVLGMPYDATGAYRLYCLDRIPLGVFELTKSTQYSFFFESLFILHLNKFPIKEIPIQLPQRTYGHSKMSYLNAFQSVIRLLKIYFKLNLNRKTLIYRKPLSIEQEDFSAESDAYVPGGGLNSEQVQKDWDIYWQGKKRSPSVIYDIIASFYRTVIIKSALNWFIFKNFGKGASLLHAGCGSGQVDVDITKKMKVTALDISRPALQIYQEHNPNVFRMIHGDIFRIPLEDQTYDGVYNLGVMEHFYEAEIMKILEEFHRILKPSGKLVIFWPPEFGLSARFLDMVHVILNKVFKKNVKLHPDEITRVKSKEQIKALFKKAHFSVDDYYFGTADFFTHAIIVASKTPQPLTHAFIERKEKVL